MLRECGHDDDVDGDRANDREKDPARDREDDAVKPVCSSQVILAQ